MSQYDTIWVGFCASLKQLLTNLCKETSRFENLYPLSTHENPYKGHWTATRFGEVKLLADDIGRPGSREVVDLSILLPQEPAVPNIKAYMQWLYRCIMWYLQYTHMVYLPIWYVLLFSVLEYRLAMIGQRLCTMWMPPFFGVEKLASSCSGSLVPLKGVAFPTS